MTQLTFETTVTGGVAAIALSGDLDVAGSSVLEAEIDRLLGHEAPATLVLDLSRLEFMDSTGLRLVVLADARAREEGWSLVLVRGGDDVQRVFDITRMTERLTFVDSVEEVL